MSLIYTHPTSRNSLYLGGKDDAKSLTKLQQRNVRRVLNVTPAKEAGITAGVPNYFEGKTGPGGYKIQYKRIGVYDASTSDMLSHADEIVNFISNGLHHGSVLVHCQRGVSRSATAVIMFLIRRANMTYAQSLKLCQRRRSVVDPIPAFCDQLRKYEKECRDWGYLTQGSTEETEEKDMSKGVVFANVHPESEMKLSTGEKRKAEGANEDSASDDAKRSKIVGPVPPPRKGPFIDKPTVKSVMGPSIGPQVGPSNKKPVSIGPANCDDSADRNKKSVGEATPPHKKRVIGPSMPPSY